ncbi:hypothetical protein ACJJTC_007029 [Scirpophaga incertulas]
MTKTPDYVNMDIMVSGERSAALYGRCRCGFLYVRKELSDIKKQYIRKEDLEDLRSRVENINCASVVNKVDFFNKRRGSQMFDNYSCNSGPVGLPHVSQVSESEISHIEKPTEISEKQKSQSHLHNNVSGNYGIGWGQRRSVDRASDRSVTSVTESVTKADTIELPTTVRLKQNDQDMTHSSPQKLTNGNKPTMSEVLCREGDWKNDDKRNKWQTVKLKRNKYRYRGMMGKATTSPNVKFKSVDIKLPIFISNVSKATLEDDILSYIKGKTSETVTLYKINMKTEKSYNSYKLYVPKDKLDIFLDDNFWPHGITYRRFVRSAPAGGNASSSD